MEYITMNMKEREQSKVFYQVISGTISQNEAAAKLNISTRWVRKKIKRYQQDGDAGLIHKNRGKISKNRWNLEHKQLTIDLLRSEWQGFGPTFTAEKLEQLHGIKVSRETIRTMMSAEGIWQVKKQRIKHRKRRERRAMRGMLVQLDGSPHDWFEGRSKKCTLLVFIDDASSEILWLEFAESESVNVLMKATKNYIEKHGIPKEFYTDHGSVFHVNLNNKDDDKKTQWERACGLLGINVIHAHSAQAKGRVERCNKTMQDRLIKEMRLAQISSIEAANIFLRNSDFIQQHNIKYALKPMQKGNAHRDHMSYNLIDIFTIRETRILAQDFTISYQKRIFQLHKNQKTMIRPKNEITIKTGLDGSISLAIRKITLNFSEIYTRPNIHIERVQKPCINTIRKPSENSRRWVQGLPPVNHPMSLESRVKTALPAVEANIGK